ncbi:hypothetical protein [Saccharopolyspora sp. SCSIO 74807]|uniref:hypothetical protein n=1 Tax=Saccharopolyspora sp. SCSIO 74807 TaxID=3118084 RepID=UPI0030CD2F1C
MHARHEIDDNARRKPSSRPTPGRGPATPASALLDLQQKLGNAAVADMIARRSSPHAPAAPVGEETTRSAHGDTGALPTAPAAVQRLAFVNGQKIPSTDGTLNDEQKKLAGDDLVHDYTSLREFEDHAAGNTDHLGNLSGTASEGTWVRFDQNLTNVLGERHSKVTLPHVLNAVDSDRFLYEPFVTDGFAGEPHTKKAYEDELGATLERVGMSEQQSDVVAHGAESLYPKLGEVAAILIKQLQRPGERPPGPTDEVDKYGRMLQGYLKIAWQYGKDVRSKEPKKPAQEKLVAEYTATKNKKSDRTGVAKAADLLRDDVNHFVKGLPRGGSLWEAFADEDTHRFAGPLESYLKVLLEELRERGKEDETAKTDATRMGDHSGMTLDDKEIEMRNRRNKHFKKAVEGAVADGVRYVGMGKDHYDALDRVPGARYYDMVDVDLRQFERETANRKNQ